MTTEYAFDEPPRAPRLWLLRHEPEPGMPRLALVHPPHPPAPPPVETVIDEPLRRQLTSVLRLVSEILDGRLPINRLERLVSDRVRRYVVAASRRTDLRIPCGSAPPRQPATGAQLRVTRIGRPTERVAEVAAACRFGTRTRALAARFELRDDDRWWCVELRLG